MSTYSKNIEYSSKVIPLFTHFLFCSIPGCLPHIQLPNLNSSSSCDPKTLLPFSLNPIPSRQKEAGGLQSEWDFADHCLGLGPADPTRIPCENRTTQCINYTFALRRWLHIHRIKYSAVCMWLHSKPKSKQLVKNVNSGVMIPIGGLQTLKENSIYIEIN